MPVSILPPPPTATPRTATPRTATSRSGTPSGLAKTTAPKLGPRMPGPRLFQVMRVGLVVWTLLSTVLCLASILASQSHQQSSAGAMVHAQDLRDLRSEVSHAQSLALASLLDPQTDEGADRWDSYLGSRTQIDLLLLTSAASADHPTDLGGVADFLRVWQENLSVAHHDALAPETSGIDVRDVTASFDDVMAAIGAESSATADQGSSSTPFIVLSIVASVLGGLGFVVVSVVTARRSHRVINIGLSIGLLAIIAAIVAVGIYASRSADIATTDSRAATLSQAQSDVWTAQAQDILSVLEPDSWQSHTASAGDLILSAQHNLAGFPALNLSPSDISTLGQTQSTIASTEDLETRKELVTNETPWKDVADTIGTLIDQQRPDSHNLVVPAVGYVITVATCCVIAIIATLAGIHARTKEYL